MSPRARVVSAVPASAAAALPAALALGAAAVADDHALPDGSRPQRVRDWLVTHATAPGQQTGCVLTSLAGTSTKCVERGVNTVKLFRVGVQLWCPKNMVIYGKMVPYGFFLTSRAPDQVKLLEVRYSF